MRTVEVIIQEVVESYAIVTYDDSDNIIEVENVEEKDRYDLEVIEVIGEVEEDEPLDDPREVE
jgi:hypothetical protein